MRVLWRTLSGLIPIKEAVSVTPISHIFLVISIPPPPIFSEKKEAH
jgi:hypothetical protein